MRVVLFSLALLLPWAASARIFDFGRESFAPYFAFSAGQSGVGKSAFDKESATNVTFSEGVSYNYSGEFGFVYSTPRASFRFGFEALRPPVVEAATANNGTDDLYSVQSDLLGYIPKLTVDFYIRPTRSSRSFVSASVGSASITLKNDYDMKAAGNAAYPGVDTSVESKGSGTLYSAAVGFEGLLSDTTTYVFEMGYRYLLIDNLAYSKDVTTFDGSGTAARSSGDPVLDNAGKQRELNFSGVFISLGFRFFL